MPRIVNKKPKYRTENRYLEMKKIKIIYTLEFCRRWSMNVPNCYKEQFRDKIQLCLVMGKLGEYTESSKHLKNRTISNIIQ